MNPYIVLVIIGSILLAISIFGAGILIGLQYNYH